MVASVTFQDMYFSWMIPNVLAGSRAPWREAEVRFLQEQGIETLVRLQEPERLLLASEALQEWGLEDFKYPIADGGAPSARGTHLVIDFIRQRIADKKPLSVTCGAGIGRTGTILACYLVAEGMSAEKAILALRGIRSPSIESAAQLSAVYDYERFLTSPEAPSPLFNAAGDEPLVISPDNPGGDQGDTGLFGREN